MERRVAVFIKIIVIAGIVIAGFGSAVLHLWNWLMPEIFGLKAITFWQALGLMGLSWILFRAGFLGHPFRGRRAGWKMQQQWRQMTPEQRAEFKKLMQERCSGRRGPRGQHIPQQHVESPLNPPVG